MSTSREVAPRGPSMADVALAAGVSAQTVSRALRGAESVSPDTRRRVLAAVDRLGYRMNTAARAMKSGRSHTFGLVLLDSAGFYSRFAITAGVEAAAEAAGYAVSVAVVGELDPGRMERALVKLADQNVEGIVVAMPVKWATPRVEEIFRAIPTVTIDGSNPELMAVLGTDQQAAGVLATDHLLDLGHPQVWHVSGPDEWIEANQRAAGWRRALLERGITPPPVLRGDWSPESGYRQGQLLARIPEVSAVFVGSDEMAFGVVKALRLAGRAVPGDISIVSVDDIALADYCDPPLTTVRQDFDKVGAAAIDLLLGASPHPPTRASRPALIIRSSTAPRTVC